MKTKRNEFPVRFEIIDLDEIPDQIDISINLPDKKASEETKTIKKQEKTNSIQLF